MYKWVIRQDFQTVLPFDVPDSRHGYCTVQHGVLTIKSGYAWDGCTPKWSVFGLFILGTPDGHVNYRTGLPFCYYPSLVHDCLYQYGIGSRLEADRLLLKMLRDAGFPLARVYYCAVRVFGALTKLIRRIREYCAIMRKDRRMLINEFFGREGAKS